MNEAKTSDFSLENLAERLPPSFSLSTYSNLLGFGQTLAWYRQLFRAQLMRKREEETLFLAPFIDKGSTIIDVGANHGWFSKEFARIYGGSCFVHCFEPLPYNFSILEKVMSSYPNSSAVKIALSDTEGAANLFVPIKENGRIAPSLPHFGGDERRTCIIEPVRTTTLDHYVSREGLKEINFIKADIEGSELLFLNGALKTLQKDKPSLLLEINSDYLARNNNHPGTIFELLSQHGYLSFAMDWERRSIIKNSSYVGPNDYLFWHKSRPIKPTLFSAA